MEKEKMERISHLSRKERTIGLNEEEKKEYSRWEKTVVKIAEQFKGFCKVNVIYDRSNLLEYKDSPSDKGENIWNILYKNKENIF